MLVAEAHSTMQVRTLIGDSHLELGRPQLCHRGLGGSEHACPRLGEAFVDEGAGDGDLHFHLGQLCLERWKVEQTAAERTTLLDEVERHRQGKLTGSEAACGIDTARHVERAGGEADSATGRSSKYSIFADAYAVEEELTQIAAAAYQGLERLALGHPGRIGVDQEDAELRPFARARHACDQQT